MADNISVVIQPAPNFQVTVAPVQNIVAVVNVGKPGKDGKDGVGTLLTPAERVAASGIWYGTQTEYDGLDSALKKSFTDWLASGTGFFEFHIFADESQQEELAVIYTNNAIVKCSSDVVLALGVLSVDSAISVASSSIVDLYDINIVVTDNSIATAQASVAVFSGSLSNDSSNAVSTAINSSIEGTLQASNDYVSAMSDVSTLLGSIDTSLAFATASATTVDVQQQGAVMTDNAGSLSIATLVDLIGIVINDDSIATIISTISDIQQSAFVSVDNALVATTAIISTLQGTIQGISAISTTLSNVSDVTSGGGSSITENFDTAMPVTYAGVNMTDTATVQGWTIANSGTDPGVFDPAYDYFVGAFIGTTTGFSGNGLVIGGCHTEDADSNVIARSGFKATKVWTGTFASGNFSLKYKVQSGNAPVTIKVNGTSIGALTQNGAWQTATIALTTPTSITLEVECAPTTNQLAVVPNIQLDNIAYA